MAVYQLKLTTVSPLHIGDGSELRQDFDFVIHDGRTYRLDENAILEEKFQQLQMRPGGAYPLPGKLLAEQDFQNERFFRYVLPGYPRSKKIYACIQSQIKDVYDRPYIPGSSLKGALRTALAWTGWSEVIQGLNRSSVGTNPKSAGQSLERRLFGRDPNHDLLRALQVGDCQAAEDARAKMILVNAQVLTHHNIGSPIELEAIAASQSFTGSLHVDECLFSALAEQELHFTNRKHWLEELLPRVNLHTKTRLEKLSAWFESVDGCEDIARFLRDLKAFEPGPNGALLQLGWGTGWDGKTFGSHLQKDAPLFEQLVRDLHMNKQSRTSSPRRAGDPYPRSRRAAVKVVERVARPAAPLGWAVLELEETA